MYYNSVDGKSSSRRYPFFTIGGPSCCSWENDQKSSSGLIFNVSSGGFTVLFGIHPRNAGDFSQIGMVLQLFAADEHSLVLATPMAFGDIPSFAWKSQKSTCFCQVDIQDKKKKKHPRKLESICLSAS